MSHFSVAVFSHHPGDVEELLAPYNEQTEDEEYLEFEEACESMEDIRARYAQEKQDRESFEDFLRRWYGYDYNEELKACGYFCNPNAKWDWWEIGGRWHNELRLKQGEKCDQAQLKDIDLSPDVEELAKARRFWEVCVEGQPLAQNENPEDFKPFFRQEYYIDQFGDKETYATRVTGFTCWAFVAPNGEWYENGQMGWFAANDATKETRDRFALELEDMLKSDPNLWLTIVDCHI